MDVQARNPTTKGSADWFIGDVFVDRVATNQGPSPWSFGSVHFSPCAHIAWHRHTLGHVYVTEGEGFVQTAAGRSCPSAQATSSASPPTKSTGTARPPTPP